MRNGVRPALAIGLGLLVVGGCSDDATQDGRDDRDTTRDGSAPSTSEVAGDTASSPGTTGEGDDGTTPDAPDTDGGALIADRGHDAAVAALLDVLPGDTRGVAVVDVDAILSGDTSGEVAALLEGEGGDPALRSLVGRLGGLTSTIDLPRTMTTALLAQTTDPGDGTFLVAALRGNTIDEVTAGPAPAVSGTYGPTSRPIYDDVEGNRLALLPGGVLVAGIQPAVESVLDVSDEVDASGGSAIVPFLDAVDADADISFVYGLPALFDDALIADATLRRAAVISGSFDVAAGDIGGEMAFHTSDAAEFVEAYNSLNRHATDGAESTEPPLTLGAPIAMDLEQVVVTVPPGPIDPSPDELVASRNTAKKLFVGTEAAAEAERVADRSTAAWLDFVVKSDQDDETPPPASSVYIRWEFKDQAAIDAFEADELPAGFTLAPTRFLESDDPDGEYFLALNLYDAGGGSIVSGARAEWDVFVHGPDGADPNAGERPRFFVVEALAEEVSADPGNLLTQAEPLSHELVDGNVVSSVSKFEDGREVFVFESAFPRPDPANAEVARFTREMAIGNDYIYWAHGVSDRVLYNATTFNHDAYFVDTAQLTYTDASRWAQYLKPEVKDAVYYVNTLEYVASPMANLDSEFLDITPEWLAELVGFTTNGHQEGLMRKAVEQLFRGEADALVGLRVENETPSTYVNFEITEPEAMSDAIELPPGHSLAPLALFEGGEERHYLTLAVTEVADSMEGTRAEWIVYTDDGDGRPGMTVIDLMTADVAVDPVEIVHLPDDVRHELVDGVVGTRLASPTLEFSASFEIAAATPEALSLDWIEAGDEVCTVVGVCDKFYYDAETLDVPVSVPVEVAVDEFTSPWDGFIEATPSVVFFRDNAQQYVVKRWHDLEVPVDELPFGGLEDRTHTVAGSGTLVGRTSTVADSTYTYTGDAVLDGDQLTFSIDQEVVNALGVGNIFTTGSFDLATGTGTQTVVDCQGPALLCSDIENGSTAFYTAQGLDASDPDALTWQVDVTVDLGGSFGVADSASTFEAVRVG